MVRNIISGKFLQEINMRYITFAWKVKEREEDPELYTQIKTYSCHGDENAMEPWQNSSPCLEQEIWLQSPREQGLTTHPAQASSAFSQGREESQPQ